MTITIHGQPKKYIITDRPFDNERHSHIHQIVQEEDPGIEGAIYRDEKTGKWEKLEIRDPNNRTAAAAAAADRAVEPDEGYEGDPNDEHIEEQRPTYLTLQLNGP